MVPRDQMRSVVPWASRWRQALKAQAAARHSRSRRALGERDGLDNFGLVWGLKGRDL